VFEVIKMMTHFPKIAQSRNLTAPNPLRPYPTGVFRLRRNKMESWCLASSRFYTIYPIPLSLEQLSPPNELFFFYLCSYTIPFLFTSFVCRKLPNVIQVSHARPTTTDLIDSARLTACVSDVTVDLHLRPLH
jgi:hypothetical protein